MTVRQTFAFDRFVSVRAAAAVCLLVLSWTRALAAGPSTTSSADRTIPDYGLAVWAADKGQPPGDVFAIAQDAEGYLWLGTPNGLHRFDGARFQPWISSNPDTALPNGPIHALVRSEERRVGKACSTR